MPKRKSSLGRKTNCARRAQEKRQREAPDARDLRSLQSRIAASNPKQNESQESRERRLLQNRVSTFLGRQNQIQKGKEISLLQHRAYNMSYAMQNESPESGEVRLLQDRASTSYTRQNESLDSRERRLLQDRSYTTFAGQRTQDPHFFKPFTPENIISGEQFGIDYRSIASMQPIISQAPIPVNPDVKLRRLPFYDVLAELMKPSSLIPKNTGRLQETLFVFHLTPQQAQDITLSRDYRPGAKADYNVQVQLRFCLLETTSEQADTFPSQIQVRVNNKPATLPNVIPTNKPNVEPKRPGRPVDITSLCRLSPTVSNAITVTWATDFTRSFCMSINLVSKLTSDILLQRLKQFGNRHSDHTKALIKEKLEQDPDSEIATTSLRVSLMCPLGKMRIQLPSRASTCTHLQCFDAVTFLNMNERKPTWNCPVCNRQCPYDKLIIDGYFVDILRKAPSYSEINFHENGSWTPVKSQKEASKQVILSNAPKSSSSSLPNSQISVIPDAPLSKPSNSSKEVVIDLTLDSSDDDDDDAVISNDPVCISPSPIINLDTPSPAPIPPMPGSPTILLSGSRSSSPFPSTSAPPPAHSHHPVLSSYTSNYSSHLPHIPAQPIRRDSSPPLGSMDSILRHSPSSFSQPSPFSSSLQAQALNLEAMSDADFDEFLKGLSWGV